MAPPNHQAFTGRPSCSPTSVLAITPVEKNYPGGISISIITVQKIFLVGSWRLIMAAVAVQQDQLYEELWKACAGSLVYVPKPGERVFYFIQGHMEQFEVLMGNELVEQIPIFDIPSKILCRVINSELQADAETDEVYLQITLLPELDQTDPQILEPCPPEPPKPTFYSFCKVMSVSNIKSHGAFSVPRNHPTECLPPLDMLQDLPRQELVTKDLHGHEWKFTHIYKGEPQRHLLTTGWSKFVGSKKMIPGDSFIFLRGEGGELRVGVRHAQIQRITHIPPVLHKSMHLRILGTASHAVATRTAFSVSCTPRLNQFIVSVNKYLRALKNDITIGTRFKMPFEGDKDPTCSFMGTIVGVGDASSRWQNSKWRSLEVQWDKPTTIHRPLRISPWEIELIRPIMGFPYVVMGRIERPVQPTHFTNNAASGSKATAFQHRGSTLSSTQGTREILGSVSSSVMKYGSPEQPQDAGPSQDVNTLTRATSSALKHHEGSGFGGTTALRLFGVDIYTNPV